VHESSVLEAVFTANRLNDTDKNTQ